jgi:uncharacterized cupredoxin-like copper-binding protein/Cu/Ag efflux protein CusF
MHCINRLIALGLMAATAVAFAHADEGHATKHGASAEPGHASALGKPGDPTKVNRTIDITMSDAMRFTPASVAARRNETIRFALKNEGKLKHEMVLGTVKELKAHAALMLKFPEMEHADPNQASVEPGQTGELVWQFTKAGRFDFGCLQSGHYEAGMKGQIVVAGASVAAQAQGSAEPSRAADLTLAQADTTATSEGEVRKVDKEAGKITLKHGEIKNLDMPGMTMVFAVKDKTMLDTLQAGDKVKFKAVSEGGKLTVTQIETVK